MKIRTFTYLAGFSIAISGALSSCVEDKNSAGLEYMPDMYRSPAIESYWDYSEVKGKFSEESRDAVSSRYNFIPPSHTIAYDGAESDGVFMPYKHGAPLNSQRTHGLYGMKQDSVGRGSAIGDLNPVTYSATIEKEGKILFETFCKHCHGAEGAGDGTVPASGKYPRPPAYDAGTTKDLTAGEIFYTITYGKGAMGAHASLLNKEERWKVVYYVQKLQGKELGSEDVMVDTLSNIQVELMDGEMPIVEIDLTEANQTNSTH